MSAATFAKLLTRIEETRSGVINRHGELRRAKDALDKMGFLDQMMNSHGLVHENGRQIQALQTYESGDYIEAARLANVASEILRNAIAQLKQLSVERESLAKHYQQASDLKLSVNEKTLAEVDEAIRDCDFTAASQLINIASKMLATSIERLQQAETLVSRFHEEVSRSGDAIIADSFAEMATKATASLEARKTRLAIATAREGLDGLQQALTEWKPELELAQPQGLVAGEWNRVSLTLTNTGKVHARDIFVVFKGLKQQGELTVVKLLAGDSTELEGALYPEDPGSVRVVTITTSRRLHDGEETVVTQEEWMDIARASIAPAPAARPVSVEVAAVISHRENIPAWQPPVSLSGVEETLVDFFIQRCDCYQAWPDNQAQLDYLHNNLERFSISSYFEVPADPTAVLHEWALPENLRGNVHLDEVRSSHLTQIIASPPNSNFAIIGEPGVGKTVLLYELFDSLMEGGPVGVISTPAVGNTHNRLGLRLFYDDIPENLELMEALLERETAGVILTAREADWQKLPERFQRMYKRLTVPLFSDEDMVPLCQNMLGFSTIQYDEKAVEQLVTYAQGSPIYVWSLIREMLFSGNRLLTRAYLNENAQKGMENYVAMILQRLLKEGSDYRPGGMHALACLVFLADFMKDRSCHELLFRSFADVVETSVTEVFSDQQNTITFNHTVAYLSGEGGTIRFPHDTWADVLAGAGRLNPFRAEIQALRLKIADERYEGFRREAVGDAWNAMLRRYRRNSIKEKDSFLALANVFTDNFRISQLEELGVDVEMIREVASINSDLPLAAKILSKIQAVKPTQMTKIINIQDSIISHSTIGEGATSVVDSIVNRSKL